MSGGIYDTSINICGARRYVTRLLCGWVDTICICVKFGTLNDFPIVFQDDYDHINHKLRSPLQNTIDSCQTYLPANALLIGGYSSHSVEVILASARTPLLT